MEHVEPYQISYIRGAMVTGPFCDSLANLMMRDRGRITGVICVESGPAVGLGAEAAMQRFMETDCRWLLQLDVDMVFPPDLFDRLRASASEDTLVSGLYFGWEPKSRAIKPIMYRIADGGTLDGITEWTPGAIVDVDATGGGCLLINRAILERTLRPWWNLEADLAFCRNLRKAGVRIVVDTSVVVGHVKPIIINEQDWESTKTQDELARIYS